jgi:hypothetical protein
LKARLFEREADSMADTYSRLGILLSVIVLGTVFAAFGLATVLLWLFGDWNRFAFGMTLTLKIMWSGWVVGFVATFLTHATISGWRFRKAHPGQGPRALAQAIAAGIKPAAWYKTPATSFTITVVLVSLLGVAVLASVLIWIIGDWDQAHPALVLSIKIIWGAWWALTLITVLVRIAIFSRQRRKAGLTKKPPVPDETEQQDENDLVEPEAKAAEKQQNDPTEPGAKNAP